LGRDPFVVRRGERIAQLIVAPVVQAAFREVEALAATPRGQGGFGSTGT
jgi:dUTP pyrophosphatase